MANAQYSVLAGLILGGLLNIYVSQLGALSAVGVELLLLVLVLDQRARQQPDNDASSEAPAT